VALLLLTRSFQTTHMTFERNLQQYLEKNMSNYVGQLIELVSIPSVSADQQHRADLQRVAKKAAGILEQQGFRTQIAPNHGFPVVIGTLEHDPQVPWLTIYNHMDVQPTKAEEWEFDPFTPALADEAVRGRGATDDKGPALAVLYAVNFLRLYNYPMPNIQVIYETEEESGSLHFEKFFDENRDVIKSPQSVLVCDTVFMGDKPTITYSLRGVIQGELNLKTADKRAHSGFFGGVAVNPLTTLFSAVASCFNSTTGEVTIPGIDIACDPELVSRTTNAASNFDLREHLAQPGCRLVHSRDPADALLRIWNKPTFEVHGIRGGYNDDEPAATAIPHEASVKFTMRITSGLDPTYVLNRLQEHVKKICMAIEVKGTGLPAVIVPLKSEFMEKAVEACEYGFGQQPVFVGCGGAIGALVTLQQGFPSTPIVMIALSKVSDGYHAPNEKFELAQARAGIKTIAHYIHSVARMRQVSKN